MPNPAVLVARYAEAPVALVLSARAAFGAEVFPGFGRAKV